MASMADNIRTARSRQLSHSIVVGRILSGLAILFLTMDAGAKLFAPDVMIANSPALGLPPEPVFYRLLGTILVGCTALYAWPRTAVIGVVLLTGYLGGAIAIHLRVASPMFSHTLFGVYVGIILWAGLWLRDPRLRRLFASQ